MTITNNYLGYEPTSIQNMNIDINNSFQISYDTFEEFSEILENIEILEINDTNEVLMITITKNKEQTHIQLEKRIKSNNLKD